MEKNQKPKKTALERIKALRFFKKSKISFVLRANARDYFEKLFGFLKPKQKKEVLAEMSKFEATTGEWKFLSQKFKSEHLKKFAFKMFKEAVGEEYHPTVTVQVAELASEPVQNTSSGVKQESLGTKEKQGFFRSIFTKKSA